MADLKRDYTDLPDDFKKLFLDTLRQIKHFGDTVSLAEFTFVVSELAFDTDLGDEDKNKVVKSFQSLVKEVFSDESYVSDKLAHLDLGKERITDLNAQGLIYLWTMLESFVKRLISALIDLDSSILAGPEFSTVKMSVSDFFGLDEREKGARLTDLLIDSLNCSRSLGINRFECVLKPFGLSGSIGEAHAKNIFAIHQLRNCVVHNASIADKHFVSNCTWMDYKVGDRIIITREELNSYEASVLAYLSEIYFRLNKSLGAPEEFLVKLRGQIDEIHGSNQDQPQQD